MVRASAALTVQLFELPEVKTLDNSIDNAHRVVFRNILARIQKKKTACRCYCKILYVNLQ